MTKVNQPVDQCTSRCHECLWYPYKKAGMENGTEIFSFDIFMVNLYRISDDDNVS